MKVNRGIHKRLNNLKSKTTLSDKDIAILKTWKTQIINKFESIDSRLDVIENKVNIAKNKFIEIEARLDALENQ